MGKGKSDRITYKPYEQDQQYLIPPSVQELIPEDHLVRLVNEVIDEMKIEAILRKRQKGGGASRYHPVMMTKLLVYGYMTKVCSSRMLAKAVRENVMFMWLSGNQKPDFRTLNEFRGKLLKGVIEEIFVTAVKMLSAKGYIKLENYFVDGTKIESASGRYTYVWKKTAEKNNKNIDEKLRFYIRMAEEIWNDENNDYGDADLEELGGKESFTSSDVKGLAGILREKLKELETTDGCEEDKKKLKKGLKTIEKDYLPRKKKYEKTIRICGKRNSHSRTDPDATFMRMKDDLMGKGHLKPAYNVQIGTENGFVTGYDIFQNPGDTKTLKPHLKRQKRRLGVNPKVVITDAGYGSEENYVYLERQGITAAVKYNTYHKDKSKKCQEDVFRTDNWEYNKKEKYYICPDGRKLTLCVTQNSKTESGYPITIEVYECVSCKHCRLQKQCKKTSGNKRINRNDRMLRLRSKACRTLEDEQISELRKQRSVEVETVFGQIKGNLGYRRHILRGIPKVSTEWGLLVLGYNLKQIYRINRDNTA